MLHLIVGLKGSGKTKALVDEVNKVARETNGAVVCIEYGRKLSSEIKYHARLVDALEYDIHDATTLYGFVCGILSANYDITELFIDSALKICQDDIPAFEQLILKLDKILQKAEVDAVITSSINPDEVPASIAHLIREIH